MVQEREAPSIITTKNKLKHKHDIMEPKASLKCILVRERRIKSTWFRIKTSDFDYLVIKTELSGPMVYYYDSSKERN